MRRSRPSSPHRRRARPRGRRRSVLPQTASSNSGGGDVAALFVSSFDPSTTAAWSGDVQRERYTCPQPSASSGTPPYTYPSDTAGDDFRLQPEQLRRANAKRHLGGAGAQHGSARNAAATIRPYIKGQTGTPPIGFDGYSIYDGVEWGYSYTATGHNAALERRGDHRSGSRRTRSSLADRLQVYSQPGMTLNDSDCETIALGWLLGMQTPPSDWNTSIGTTYPARYYTGANGTPSPFGGVYHSTPAIATPPSALLRDDSYQSFSQYYTSEYATYHGLGHRAAPYGPLRGDDRRPPPRFRRRLQPGRPVRGPLHVRRHGPRERGGHDRDPERDVVVRASGGVAAADELRRRWRGGRPRRRSGREGHGLPADGGRYRRGLAHDARRRLRSGAWGATTRST